MSLQQKLAFDFCWAKFFNLISFYLNWRRLPEFSNCRVLIGTLTVSQMVLIGSPVLRLHVLICNSKCAAQRDQDLSSSAVLPLLLGKWEQLSPKVKIQLPFAESARMCQDTNWASWREPLVPARGPHSYISGQQSDS